MKREEFEKEVLEAFAVHPVVAILGPRQCGKTTLARHFAKKQNHLRPENYFDLEDTNDLARLGSPQTTLSLLDDLIIIDEIQRKPDLFQTLRVLVDNPDKKYRFLILGSASRELLCQSSETLSGRIQYIELTPFNLEETKELSKLWERGGFPRSFLADDEKKSLLWRNNYLRTFTEQDIPGFGFRIPPQHLKRFWMMLAHHHGNIFNASEIARSLQLTHKTVKYYLDILSHTLMVRQLQPWFENISKRQVKSPKIYFRDSGLFHSLLGVDEKKNLLTHPKLGASWEGFALEEVIRAMKANPSDCFFWATFSSAEIDLIIVQGLKKIGFEFKYTDRPKITKSMQIALEDLQLEKIYLVFPGKKSFPLSEKIQAVSFEDFIYNIAPLIRVNS
ncbi:MAG: ATP-binding protein [Chlamydiales bacterium]